ncbi:MAG: hypothetical protein V7638_4082 [Acidobacteriota bacterium]|jgi:hypothetical protein
MKPVKNLVFAALLVLSIALNTFAGDVQVPGAPAPEPSPRVAVSNPETDTDTPETDETADYLFLEVLTALLSVY